MIRLRASLAILLIIAAAFCANSMNASLFLIFLFGVVAPTLVLLVSDNDGYEIDPYFGWLRDELVKWKDYRLAKLKAWFDDTFGFII